MGRPQSFKDEDLLEILRARRKLAMTTGDIADELGVHRKTAHQRLKKLEGKEVKSEEMGSADVWYLATNDPFIQPSHTADGGLVLFGGRLHIIRSTRESSRFWKNVSRWFSRRS